MHCIVLHNLSIDLHHSWRVKIYSYSTKVKSKTAAIETDLYYANMYVYPSLVLIFFMNDDDPSLLHSVFDSLNSTAILLGMGTDWL